MSDFVQYNTGTPPRIGVYACRVPTDDEVIWKDIFLLWHGGQWCRLGSDQRYRDAVPYWIGPLRRQPYKENRG